MTLILLETTMMQVCASSRVRVALAMLLRNRLISRPALAPIHTWAYMPAMIRGSHLVRTSKVPPWVLATWRRTWEEKLRHAITGDLNHYSKANSRTMLRLRLLTRDEISQYLQKPACLTIANPGCRTYHQVLWVTVLANGVEPQEPPRATLGELNLNSCRVFTRMVLDQMPT